MKNLSIKIVLTTLILFFALGEGCREEIIPPNNPAGNINEPVSTNTRNTYSFVINAENLDIDVTDYPKLFSNHSRMYFYISDYGSGSVEVSLRNQNSVIFYNDVVANNLDGQYIEVRNNYTSSIQIKCSAFSGKLKIQISSL